LTLISAYKYPALTKTIFWEFKLQFSAVLLFARAERAAGNC